MSAIKEYYHAQTEAAQQAATERPILFTADMVRAILDGRKTQTRRTVKPNTADWFRTLSSIAAASAPQNKFCTYGYPGDRLWVRETWAEFSGIEPRVEYIYRADGLYDTPAKEHLSGHRWRPSIHMPRAAARIHLLITDIRAERLQDITQADAIAEGINSFRPVPGDGAPETLYRDYMIDKKAKTGQPVRKYPFTSPIESYRTLWKKINGPDAWEINPWVWVITFKVL